MPKPFSISVDAKQVVRALREIAGDDAPFVTAYALTKTGQDIKAAEIAEMQQVFDKPVPYTLNALQLKPATKKDLTAVVGYRAFAGKGTPAERYLGPQVDGGKRSSKSHEKALRAVGALRENEYCVPGKEAKLDAYGNMNRGQMVQILSQVQASRDATQNMTAKSRKRAVKRAGGRYFVLRAGAAPGVYLRPEGRMPILPVLMFVKEPMYQKRFPFHEVAQRVFDSRFMAHARAAWASIVAKRQRAA